MEHTEGDTAPWVVVNDLFFVTWTLLSCMCVIALERKWQRLRSRSDAVHQQYVTAQISGPGGNSSTIPEQNMPPRISVMEQAVTSAGTRYRAAHLGTCMVFLKDQTLQDSDL